ncbi:hypothetical protein GCM10020000_01650 [Streptomyces olivoverticillatus]
MGQDQVGHAQGRGVRVEAAGLEGGGVGEQQMALGAVAAGALRGEGASPAVAYAGGVRLVVDGAGEFGQGEVDADGELVGLVRDAGDGEGGEGGMASPSAFSSTGWSPRAPRTSWKSGSCGAGGWASARAPAAAEGRKKRSAW